MRNWPSSSWANWRHEVFATLLLGSDCSRQKSTLPAVSTGSRLQANLRRPLLLSCVRWSTCSVLSETMSIKHGDEDKVKVQVRSCTFHLKPTQVNLDSYDHFTSLCKSELGQHPTETNKYAIIRVKKKKTFNHFSLRGTQRILPSSSWATWHHAVFATPLLGSANT